MIHPHPLLEAAWDAGEYAGGSTEPWAVRVLTALIEATNACTVLETGGYLGHTSAAIALTLDAMRGQRELLVIEHDLDRCGKIRGLLNQLSLANVNIGISHQEALTAIHRLDNNSLDLVFVDDDHTAAHVENEIMALFPKVRRDGLIILHDVCGPEPLSDPFGLGAVTRRHGGIVLPLRVLHRAGGIGVIRVQK